MRVHPIQTFARPRPTLGPSSSSGDGTPTLARGRRCRPIRQNCFYRCPKRLHCRRSVVPGRLPPESRRQPASSCARNCCCARRGEAKSGRSQEDSPCTRTADSPDQPKRLRQNQKLRSSRKMSGSSSRFFLLSRDSLSCRQLDGGDGCTPSSPVSTVDQPVPHVSLCQRRRYHGRKGEVERQLDPRFVGRACEAVNQPEEYRTTLHLFRIAELKKPRGLNRPVRIPYPARRQTYSTCSRYARLQRHSGGRAHGHSTDS